MAESVPTTNSSPRASTGVGLVDSYLPTHPSRSSTAIMPQRPVSARRSQRSVGFLHRIHSMIGKGGATFRSNQLKYQHKSTVQHVQPCILGSQKTYLIEILTG